MLAVNTEEEQTCPYCFGEGDIYDGTKDDFIKCPTCEGRRKIPSKQVKKATDEFTHVHRGHTTDEGFEDEDLDD